MPFVWPRLPLDVNRVDAVVIHHTVTFFLSLNATVEEEKAHIQMIHLYHKSIDYIGFAYHFITFPSGRAYLVVPLNQYGTHVLGNNDHLWGIAAAGNFASVLPNDFQRDGVTDCIAACYAYKSRRLPIRPHKAYVSTTCPGRWYEILNELIPEEDDMERTEEEIRALVRDEMFKVAFAGYDPETKRPVSGKRNLVTWAFGIIRNEQKQKAHEATPHGGTVPHKHALRATVTGETETS
jgi:hypothetical protein